MLSARESRGLPKLLANFLPCVAGFSTPFLFPLPTVSPSWQPHPVVEKSFRRNCINSLKVISRFDKQYYYAGIETRLYKVLLDFYSISVPENFFWIRLCSITIPMLVLYILYKFTQYIFFIS